MVIFIYILIGMIVTLCVGNVIKEIVEDHKVNKEIEASWRKRELELNPPVDADGHRVKYDAHYARQLEAEQGLPQTVRCEDTTCTTCYWKPRMLADRDSNLHVYPGISTRRREFIEGLMDGLSDDLYDLLYADFLEEIQPELDELNAKMAEDAERERREDLEKYYCTPYDKIQQYLAEGRTYKPVTGWSTIPRPATTHTTLRQIQIRQAATEALKSGNKLLGELNLSMKEALCKGNMADYHEYEAQFKETKQRLALIKKDMRYDNNSNIILP